MFTLYIFLSNIQELIPKEKINLVPFSLRKKQLTPMRDLEIWAPSFAFIIFFNS
jgi:hypothetical protein